MNTFVRRPTGVLGLGARVSAASLLSGTVSVIMVVYRTGPALYESIRRVLADPMTDEFVVVDNGSSPEEARWLDAAAAADRRMKLLRGQGNVGFARGANMGALASSGRVLVFLNPDAFLEDGCLQSLTEALALAPSPRMVGARVLNADGSEQRGARRGELTPVTTFLSLTRLSRVGLFRRFEVHQEHAPTPCGRERVATISGACFAMTREDFSAMGGFDESYFLHVEDVDLCWRVRQSGGAVLFDPRARVTHLGSTSLKAPVLVEYWKGVGLARYFRKRANNTRRRILAICMTPLIVGVSVLRPLLRGQVLRRKPRSA